MNARLLALAISPARSLGDSAFRLRLGFGFAVRLALMGDLPRIFRRNSGENAGWSRVTFDPLNALRLLQAQGHLGIIPVSCHGLVYAPSGEGALHDRNRLYGV
jgi:hypothetical protein